MSLQKDIIKQQLAEKLISNKLFWSYCDVSPESISDNILIEKVLINLDLEDIDSLFEIYPYKKIREIWKNEIIVLEPLYHSMNLLLAFLYFQVKNPERYISNICQKHLLSLK
jgi:hypothetical protein